MNGIPLIPILATLFGLAEFASEWPWRRVVQTGLLLAAMLAQLTTREDSRPSAGYGVLLSLICAAAGAHGGALGWALLSVAALWAALRTSGTLLCFTLTAAGTWGAAWIHMQTSVLWDLDGSSLAMWLASSLPSASVLNEWLVLDGQRVHRSAFGLLPALPACAAVLAWRSVGCGRMIALGCLGLLLATLLRIGFAMFWIGLGQPVWAVSPESTGLYVAASAAALAFATPSELKAPSVSLGAGFLSGCAGLFAAAALLPGTLPPPRALSILVDEAHGEWETTQRPYGTERYGRDTVYTYSLLREWLERRHRVELQAAQPLRPRGDLLIVKMPALPYTEDEKQAVLEFVERGGGLLAIGDHTNLFGTSDHLNALLRLFGLSLRADAAIPTTGLTRRLRAEWWNASALLPAGTEWESQTAATITGAFGRGRPLIVDSEALSETAEFSNDRNFGDLRPSFDDRRPPLVVAATATEGGGPVVVLADSTPWSNFSFFAPGNEALLDAAVRLAAASPSRKESHYWPALLGAGCLAGALWSGGRPIPTLGIAAAALAALAAFTAPHGAASITPLKPGAVERRLVVDGELSSGTWETDVRVGRLSDRDVFSAFLAWASRMGVHPRSAYEAAYLDIANPVLILNPTRRVTRRRVAEAQAFVREGGRILLLDDPARRPDSTAAELLEDFGIHYRSEVIEAGVHNAGGPPLPTMIWTLPLTLLQDSRRSVGAVLAGRTTTDVALLGVEPRWVDSQGLVIYGSKAIGKGQVSVFIRSHAFSQAVMGDVWGGTEPGPEKMQVYDLEYALLGDLFPRAKDETDLLEERPPS